MRLLIATLMLLFGAFQSAPTNPNGVIEGTVTRTSTSEPISGVQVVLTAPVQPQTSSATLPGAPTNTASRPQETLVPPVSTNQQIEIIRTPEGGIQLRTGGAGGPTTAADLEAVLANLQRNAAPAAEQTTVTTDSDGKFAFRNLAPGNYSIRAQRDGFFGPETPTGTFPPVITRSVKVESDKTIKLDFGLVQAGVMRGTLRDPDGQPAPNYAFVIARPAYANGRAIWNFGGARNSDDRGEYRWPNLPPGEYFVGSGPRAPGPIANVQDGWTRVFAPGVADPNQARPVIVEEGKETTVDLTAQLKPHGVFKISGMAVNPLPNLAPDPATGVINRAMSGFVLMPYDLTPLDNPPVSSWTNTIATNAKADGSYELSNVEPGRYELYAMAQDAQNRRIWAGHVRIEMRDHDLTGITIAVSPGETLSGTVAIKGNTALKPETVRVQLQALGMLPPQVATAVGAVQVDESGNFKIANLADGRYRLNVSVPGTAYVAAVQQGSVNIFDDGFDVNEQTSQNPIRIEVDTAGETVEGDVKAGPTNGAPSSMVVLVPEPQHRNNPAFYKTASTDDKGHFAIRGVAPGSYTAFAWEVVLPGAYQNADFLAKYATRGKVLNVQPASKNTIDLDLIRKE